MQYKIAGLLGGIGPESTVDYYKMIINKFRERLSTDEYPQFLINNINMTEMLGYVYKKDFNALTVYLAQEIRKLELAGADFAAMASNTPHIVFDELQRKVNLPLISIVEETCREMKKNKVKIAGLFGTLSTMNGGFYQRKGEVFDISVITPSEAEKKFVNKKYFEELVPGIINPSTKQELIKIACDMKINNGIKGLILGGTELPLILHQDDFNDLIIFNTAQIHINSIINKMIEN